jgi:hypothetical protein
LVIAIQLSSQWLLPSKNGATNSAGEEQADLLFETQGTSVHVQRQTGLSATFTVPKVEKIIAPRNRELHQQSMNSYDV